MSRSGAIKAMRKMREAVDDGNIQLASYWACVFLAEDQGAATGDHLREQRLSWQENGAGEQSSTHDERAEGTNDG
jgi:hypothetical protein